MHAIVSVQDFKGLNTYVCMCAYERERERVPRSADHIQGYT